MNRVRVSVRCGLSALLFAAWSLSASAATPRRATAPPTAEGFGKAKFGMSLEQVRHVYPKIVPAQPGAGAAYFKSPLLDRFALGGVRVAGLGQPVDFEFRFWKNQLWGVIVYYGGNGFSDVAEDLYRRFGKAATEGIDPTWVKPTATITTAPTEGWYSITDNRRTKDVQQEFARALAAEQAVAAARAARANPTPATPPAQNTPPAAPPR